MPLTRLIAVGVTALVLVLGSALTLAAFTARQVQTHAEQAQLALLRVQERAAAADVPGTVVAIADARAQIKPLLQDTTSPLWTAATRLPLIGDTAQAVTVIAEGADAVLSSTSGLTELADTSQGTADLVAQLPAIMESLEPIKAATETALTHISNTPMEQLRFGVGDVAAQASQQLTALSNSLSTILDNKQPLESLLGFDGPRTYLVMLQNPAEARGSGGLFSAFMRITMDKGQITIDEANSRKVLDEWRIPIPNGIDQGERSLWGDYLTKWASFNVSPDFPTTARLARAGMQARGTPVDGVIAIDPTVVEAVLAGTGPVEHKGITIDSSTAADFFTQDIYEDFPGFADVEAKDELALGLLYATVDSVLNRPLDVSSLTKRIQQVSQDQTLKAWLANPAEREWITEWGLSGALTSIPDEEQAYFLNNATGGKVDIYLNTNFETNLSPCVARDEAGSPAVLTTTRLTLTNTAPTELPEYVDVRLDSPSAPKGSTRVLATIIGAQDASEVSASGAGDFTNVTATTLHGRPSWTSDLEVPRGESTSMEVLTERSDLDAAGLPDCVGR